MVSNRNQRFIILHWTPRVCRAGVYGDVVRVKILFQKQSNALVQMNDYTQAQLGTSHFLTTCTCYRKEVNFNSFYLFISFSVITHLQGVRLFGKALQISMSRHSQVQMPKEGQDANKLTQVSLLLFVSTGISVTPSNKWHYVTRKLCVSGSWWPVRFGGTRSVIKVLSRFYVMNFLMF